jgi:membrane associated rhomboid family serine protease
MDVVILPQHWITLLIMAIILLSLLLFIVKKWMITYALIISNIIIFLIWLIYRCEIMGWCGSYAGLGFRPIYLSKIELLPNIYTLFTCMFIHSGFAHIFGNMFIFFFMGHALEQRIGWRNLLVIYTTAGVCGTLTHALLYLDSTIPLVGASGAIFGILGAFAFLYPRDEIVMPVPVGIMIITRIRVIYAAILFALMETIIVIISGDQDSTAHFAHLGGLIGGIAIAALLKNNIKNRVKNERIIKNRGREAYTPLIHETKTIDIDINQLRRLAKTPQQLEIIDRIEKETLPQVKETWIEHLLDKTPCPVCGKVLYHFNRSIWCESCGFKTRY